ncbi:MAG: NAD(+) synthase [Candidatus Omnitrophica bacterium]|nr:NAD(+) synthase [Candidatus Omnitrophota bacterium]
MNIITVAGAGLNQTPLAWDDNKAHILAAILEARRSGAGILCLPELSISGYGCEDTFQSRGVLAMSARVLKEIIPATKGIAVCLGLPLAYENDIFNAVCFAVNGTIAGFVAKKYLAGDGLHYEPRWFKPWPRGARAAVALGGKTYPVGDLIFDLSGIRVGFEICEEAWVPQRPGAELARQGVDIILNPSASHFAFGKHEVRKRFVLDGSRAFGAAYVYSNLVGCEAGRIIYDGGVLIAAGGNLLAHGKRFTYNDVIVSSGNVDIDTIRMSRSRTAGFTPRTGEKSDRLISRPFKFPGTVTAAGPADTAEPWENRADVKKEEFSRSVSLGLFDYLRKSRAQGFVVSLSGGVDSSTVSCLVALMVRFGVEELGLKGFIRKLAYIRPLKKAQTEKDIVREILTCVYQATKNSSSATRRAAYQVAYSIGARFYEFDVEPLVNDYVKIVSGNIGRPLSWATDDIPLQNIQARARAPGVWLLANERHALLLATSNRSETAVGYATMDGDTCGGLGPIAGVDKAFLRQWLIWLEKEGPLGAFSIPALSRVNEQKPTAELRPLNRRQTDEKDLMPYDVLDIVERYAIRDKKTPLEIFLLTRKTFTRAYGDKDLALWIERFFKLWCRNQWKRERYAPSFHLDDENLDPKTWCRFPILSGNYERELGELRGYVKKRER